MSAKRTVAVSILGHEYRIRTDVDPESVRRAAALVDETVARIRSRTATVDSLDVALLAALNLAKEVVALRDGAGTRSAGLDSARLAELVALLETAVGDPAPAHH
jgi:cell division protein ZapA